MRMPFTALAGHHFAYRNRANATDANRPCCTDDGHSEAPLEDEIDECTCTAWSRVPWKDCHDAAPEAEDRGSETANEDSWWPGYLVHKNRVRAGF